MKVCNFEQESLEGSLSAIECIKNECPRIAVLPVLKEVEISMEEILMALNRMEPDKAVDALHALLNNVVERLHARLEDNCFAEASQALYREVKEIEVICFSMMGTEDREIFHRMTLLSSSIYVWLLRGEGMDAGLLVSDSFVRLDMKRNPDLCYMESCLGKACASGGIHALYVAQSGLCRDAYGEICSIHRGGTDFYGLLVAAAAKADEYVAWSAGEWDCMRTLSYAEAATMIESGIGILPMRCIELAREHGVSIRLMKAGAIREESLFISGQASNVCVKAITVKNDMLYLKIKSNNELPGFLFLGKIFDILSHHQVKLSLITSSYQSVSLALSREFPLRGTIHELERYADVELEQNLSVVSVIGNFAAEQTGIESDIMNVLHDVPLRMISYGSSENSVSVVVPQKDSRRTVDLLKGRFFNFCSSLSVEAGAYMEAAM